MRVVIAGARSPDVFQLQRTLGACLPSGLNCVAWQTELALSKDDIVLLLGISDATAQAIEVEIKSDAEIRSALAQSKATYQVIYGDADTQLQEARHAIAQALQQRDPTRTPSDLREELKPRWQGWCDACSDPECEHRLFRQWVTDKPSLQ